MQEIVPCPKCGRMLRRSGVIDIEDSSFATFQCDRCIVSRPVFGDTALTFAVDAEGKPFDPAADDYVLRF